jgi:hypothetical protein
VEALLDGETDMSVQSDAGDDEDEDDQEETEDEKESVQCVLLDVCVDILSNVQTNDPEQAATQSHANTHIKGIRDAVRNVFACLAAERGDVAVVYAIVDALADGCDQTDETGGADGEDMEEDGEDDGAGEEAEAAHKQKDVKISPDQLMSLLTGEEDEIKVDEKEDEKQATKPKKAKAGTAQKSSVKPSDDKMIDEADDDSNQEETDEADDSDDGSVNIEEWARQDQALNRMLALKHQSRKSGFLEALRIQTNNRSRVLDILEVCLHSANDAITGHALTYTLRKVCLCLKYVCTSKVIQSLSEGVAFASRLMNFMQTKLCARKFRNFASLTKQESAEDAEGEETGFEEELTEYTQTMELIVTLCRHPHAGIRECAQTCFGSLLKSALWLLTNTQGNSQAPVTDIDADKLEQVMEAVMTPIIDITNELIDRKHTKLNISLIDNLLNRFPHILVLNSHLLHHLLRGCVSSKSVFMCLHCVQSSMLAIKNMCTHGLLSSAGTKNQINSVSLQDLCSNIFSSVQTLLQHINATLKQCLQNDSSKESLRRRAADFILAGKDVLLTVKLIAKSNKVSMELLLSPRSCP